MKRYTTLSTNIIPREILKKNMDAAIARYKKRYENGHCTYNELQALISWEQKNYENGGMLYATKLARALTPRINW